jgi:hypothetical protein
LVFFYDSLLEGEDSAEVIESNSSKRQKSGSSLFHQGSSAAQGKAPDVSSIKVNKATQESFGETKESDEQRISARIKQILFGKNTTGYDNYISAVPKNKRQSRKDHPRTPDPYLKTSKRCFDGIVKAWRRQLHQWDNIDTLPKSSKEESFPIGSLADACEKNVLNADSHSLKENSEADAHAGSSSEDSCVHMISVDDDEDVL